MKIPILKYIAACAVAIAAASCQIQPAFSQQQGQEQSIHIGKTRAQIFAELGAPTNEAKFDGEEVWIYTKYIANLFTVTEKKMSVTFRNGVVVLFSER